MLRDLGLKPDYGDTPEYIIRNAANRGKLVEMYCLRLIQNPKEPLWIRTKHTGSQHLDVSVRVGAFYKWMKATSAEYVDSHDFVWSAKDRVCWQRDLRVKISGRLTLVDIKATSKAEKDWPLQVGCGLSYDEDGCDRGGILHLNPKLKDGYKFREYDAATVKSQYRRAVDRWHSNRDFQLLRNELGFDSEAFGFETEEGD